MSKQMPYTEAELRRAIEIINHAIPEGPVKCNYGWNTRVWFEPGQLPKEGWSYAENSHAEKVEWAYSGLVQLEIDLRNQIEGYQADIKTCHELLDSNGIGLAGEPLLARISDVVAEFKASTAPKAGDK